MTPGSAAGGVAPVASLPRDTFGRGLDESEPTPPGDGDADGSGRSRLRVIGAVALVVAVVAAVVTVGALALGGSDGSTETTTTGSTVAPVGGSGTPAPQASAPSGPPEEVLRSLVNPATLSGCNGVPNVESQWADAQLTCIGPQGVAVDVYHFSSQSSVDRQIGALATYIVDQGDCDAGQQSIEDWSTPAEPTGGVRLCYFYANNFVIYWFYQADRVAFSVEHPDPAQLVTWWHNIDPIKH